MLRKGFSKGFAAFFIFLVSAIFHEWIVSGALGVIEFHAFLGMLL
jgi:hypothetical protein